LDKTVPLKDSGVDWIGQIPEGWGVGKLKYYFDGHTTIDSNSNFITFNIRELMNADRNIRA
jgi:type I restriction enzyme S subunit